jgi:hypothetical protein
VLSAEAAAAFDDLTRNKEQLASLTGQSPGDWPNTFRSSRFIPAVEYIRAMRARRLLMQEMDRADVAVRRLPQPRAGQQQPAGDEPDRSPRDRAEERLHRQHAAGDHGHGPLVRRSNVCRVALRYEQATEWHNEILRCNVRYHGDTEDTRQFGKPVLAYAALHFKVFSVLLCFYASVYVFSYRSLCPGLIV